MTNLIKQFIEKHITLIEEKEYDLLYEEAYRIFTDSFCAELTAILTDVLGEDFNAIAKSVALEHLEENLEAFIADKQSFMSLPSFLRLYMDGNICGVDFYEFRDFIITNPPKNSGIRLDVDNDGELYFQRVQ